MSSWSAALRERPDRIVVGECRDDETYEMLQAMQTGHDGSLTTIHANDCAGAFTRIENMILKSQGNMTMEAIRRQIGAAIDVVVQVKRWRGGYRRIESITAVEGFSDGNVTRNELFHWEGSPENGRHVATGYQPARLKEKILDADAEYDPVGSKAVSGNGTCRHHHDAERFLPIAFHRRRPLPLFCGLSAAGDVRRMRNSTALRTGGVGR